MERIQPWTTTIGKFNIADQVDLDVITGAVLANSMQVNGSFASIDPNSPEVAYLLDLRDRCITPKVLEYIRDEFGMNLAPQDVDILSQCVCIQDGADLEHHIHAMSSLTVVMYPVDAASRLVLVDPRGNAARGYPSYISRGHFGNYRITPKAGDVYIIPSYILHSVNAVRDELRLSFVNDYFLDPN